MDGLLGLAREVLRQEVGVVGVEGGRLLDGRLLLFLDAEFARFAALALLRGLFHPGALTLLLGEGGALLLTAHGRPLWPTEPAITHHGAMSLRPLVLTTSDAVSLEAEIATPEGSSTATAVLCHPHPQYGGTMRSIVIGALFDALPDTGVTCLRFNFRGVERSTGTHDEGRGELLDVQDRARHRRRVGRPGGAAAAGGVVVRRRHDPGHARSAARGLARRSRRRCGSRPSSVQWPPTPARSYCVLGQHDEFREPASVVEATEDWNATDIEVIAGASHFFVGRTDRVVDAARAFVERVVG